MSDNKSRSKSRSKSPKPREFPITASRKYPKIPKNKISNSKNTSHHSLNPIVHWPASETDLSAKDKQIKCSAPNLPSRVVAQLAALARQRIQCSSITLKSNGTYTIFANNGMNYVILARLGTGKHKRKPKKHRKTKKHRK
jgi:hypothetical protein